MDGGVPLSKIADLLRYRGHSELAYLLAEGDYSISSTGRFGTTWNATEHDCEIRLPVDKWERARALDLESVVAIRQAFEAFYPAVEGGMEIGDIEFRLDPEAEIPLNTVVPTELSRLNVHVINVLIGKVDDRIASGDFDGAITASRSLVESVCKFILDAEEIGYSDSLALPKLYAKTAEALEMAPAMYKDEQALRQVVAGLHQAVDGLANLRNTMGDSHGASPNRSRRAGERHARLAINSAKTAADFLVASYAKRHGA